MAQLSSKAREDPAPPNEEFSETGSEAGADAVGMLSFILKETEAEEKAAHEDEESALAAYEDTMADLKTNDVFSRTKTMIAVLDNSSRPRAKWVGQQICLRRL